MIVCFCGCLCFDVVLPVLPSAFACRFLFVCAFALFRFSGFPLLYERACLRCVLNRIVKVAGEFKISEHGMTLPLP